MDPSKLIDQIATIALVLSRVSGFMVLSPFPGAWVPRKARATLVLTLSLAVGLLVGTPKVPVALDLNLLPVAVSDFAVGMLIGGAFRFTVSAAEFMAGVVSQASWLSTPLSMNPDMGGQTQVLGQVSMLFALLLALGAGVHRIVLGYLLQSFYVLPVGGTATVRVVEADGRAAISLDAVGPRAKLKPEVLRGLKGEPRGDAVGGAWVQAYYLHLIVKGCGGQLAAEAGEDKVTLAAWAPVSSLATISSTSMRPHAPVSTSARR